MCKFLSHRGFQFSNVSYQDWKDIVLMPYRQMNQPSLAPLLDVW